METREHGRLEQKGHRNNPPMRVKTTIGESARHNDHVFRALVMLFVIFLIQLKVNIPLLFHYVR